MRWRLEYVVDWVQLRWDVDRFDDSKFSLPLRHAAALVRLRKRQLDLFYTSFKPLNELGYAAGRCLRRTMTSYRHKPPELVGGALCVDFTNTVTWRGDPQDCGERLTSFEELLAWALAAGVVDRKQAASIAAAAAANPSKSAAAVADAILLREAIARLLEGKSDSSATVDLATVNRVLRESPPPTALTKQGGRFDWQDSSKVDLLRLVLVKVARSAADVLTSERLEKIRSCSDQRCGWLFIDNSRTGERRWCNMKTCGNRAKARLHYQRALKRPASRSRAR